MTKAELRKSFKTQRQAIGPEEWYALNQALIHQLVAFINQHKIENVFAFYGSANEPHILHEEFFKHIPSTTHVFLPVVADDHSMEFYAWKPGEGLSENIYRIPEPKVRKRAAIPDEDTLICVPALAMDREGNRLGMGKGYYDRYLERFPKSKTIALLFEQFLVSGIPAEAHDIKPHFILTEKNLIKM